jgi:hypothetical protein
MPKMLAAVKWAVKAVRLVHSIRHTPCAEKRIGRHGMDVFSSMQGETVEV